MAESNGEKRTLIYWLGIIIMGLTTWALVGMVQAKTDIAALQANYKDIHDRLDSIERKMDRFILVNNK